MRVHDAVESRLHPQLVENLVRWFAFAPRKQLAEMRWRHMDCPSDVLNRRRVLHALPKPSRCLRDLPFCKTATLIHLSLGPLCRHSLPEQNLKGLARELRVTAPVLHVGCHFQKVLSAFAGLCEVQRDTDPPTVRQESPNTGQQVRHVGHTYLYFFSTNTRPSMGANWGEHPQARSSFGQMNRPLAQGRPRIVGQEKLKFVIPARMHAHARIAVVTQTAVPVAYHENE